MSNILTKSINKKLSRRTFLKASAAATTLAALGDKLLGGPVSTLVEGVAGAATEDVWIPTFCNICGRGPEVCKVHRVDGTVVGLEGNQDFVPLPTSLGRICLRPIGQLQKAYHPFRVKAPMKRTNPVKGYQVDPVTGETVIDPATGYPVPVDPGWMEISWDEALDTVAGWMSGALAYSQAHPWPELDVDGKAMYGNLGYSPGSGGMSGTKQNSWGSLQNACETLGLRWDDSIRGGGGIHCTMSEHVFCSHLHQSGAGYVDIAHCNYVIHSRNFLAQGGIPTIAGDGGWSDARTRPVDPTKKPEKPIHTVFLSPYAPNCMAFTDEWVPIKVKTEVAFFMAMAYVMVHEFGLARLDETFLKKTTNSPYLISSNGYILRDATSGKPLVWDTSIGAAREFNDPTLPVDPANNPVNYALEGTYTASGIERRSWSTPYVETPYAGDVKPAYQVLKDHLLSNPSTPAGMTPEWAAPLCDIPAATIRRITDEFVTEAKIVKDGAGNTIGETITLDGVTTMNWRPAGINASKGYNTGLESNKALHAVHILQMLIGALEHPGTHGGGSGTIAHEKDGYPPYHVTPWHYPAQEFSFRDALVPAVGAKHKTMHNLGAWMILNEGKPGGHNVPIPKRLGYINYHSNPVLSVQNYETQVEVIKDFPWAWGLAYTLTETNEHCDILLPDNGDMETSHLGAPGAGHGKRVTSGNIIRQRVCEPPFDSRNPGDIATELAARMGILNEYYTDVNKGISVAAQKITLPTTVLYPWDEAPGPTDPAYPWDTDSNNCILNRKALSTNCFHPGGPGVTTAHKHNLATYKATGGYIWPIKAAAKYTVAQQMESKRFRYPIPYSEQLKVIGEELQPNLNANGLTWWNTIDYVALPSWHDPADPYYERGPDYDLHCLTTRVWQFGWANNAEIPWMKDAGEHMVGVAGLAMNPDYAAAHGLNEGDEVWIESPLAKEKAKVLLVKSIRPDCVCLASQGGHYTTPVAKDYMWPSQNRHHVVHPRWVEKVTGGAPNVTMVKVTKV